MADDWVMKLRQKDMAERAARRAENARRDEHEAKARAAAKIGGMRLARRGSVATIFSVSGPNRERETAAGTTTMVSPLLDPRLKLTDRQRITGQAFGAYTEDATIAGSSEFLKPFIDRHGSSGGYSERKAEQLRMVRIATEALNDLPAFTYPLGKARGAGGRGRHDPIPALNLAHDICSFGLSFETIGGKYGWWVQQKRKDRLVDVVPVRQKGEIGKALCVVLDRIDDAWDAYGLAPPFDVGGIEVE